MWRTRDLNVSALTAPNYEHPKHMFSTIKELGISFIHEHKSDFRNLLGVNTPHYIGPLKKKDQTSD